VSPTKVGGYYVGSTRVPSVTTILSTLGWGTDALLTWANNLGLEGKCHTEERGKAADIGTCAHEMIDSYLHKRLLDSGIYSEEIVDAAMPAFQAYCEWACRHRIEVIMSEKPLVSAAHRYGGTPDAIVRMDGKAVLLDFKTSNWLYPKHIIQVVAYLDLIAEVYDKHLDTAIVLRVGKDGIFKTLTVEGDAITQGREAFYHLLQLYKLKSPLEKLTKQVNFPGTIGKSAELTVMGVPA
jgi:hypothetical protein